MATDQDLDEVNATLSAIADLFGLSAQGDFDLWDEIRSRVEVLKANAEHGCVRVAELTAMQMSATEERDHLAAQLAEAQATIATVLRARDQYDEERRAQYQEMCGWKGRAELAERELQQARENLDETHRAWNHENELRRDAEEERDTLRTRCQTLREALKRVVEVWGRDWDCSGSPGHREMEALVGEICALLTAARPAEDYTAEELACPGCTGPCGRCHERPAEEGR